MESMKFHTLHSRAKAALESASLPPKRLFLIFALGLALPSLVIDGLYYCLFPFCSNGGPLDSGNYEAILISANGTLNFLFSLFRIFWSYSLTVCLLKISRQAECGTDNLKDGFHLWKRVIGAVFFMTLRIFLLVLISSLLTSFLTVMLLDLLHPAALGLLILAVLAVVLVPGLYSLWAVPYLAVDSEGVPAVALCGLSQRLMRGNRKSVFLVQLHFVWYDLAFGLLSSLPAILSMAKLDLPTLLQTIDWTSAEAVETLSAALAAPVSFPWNLLILLAQCVLAFLYYIWKYGEIQMTYTMAYNAIVEAQMPKDQQQLPDPGQADD